MFLNDQEYILKEFDWLFKEKMHIKIMYSFFILLNILTLPLSYISFFYTISAQVATLKTLHIDFSIKLPTKWYIATLVTILVPRGCNETF